MFSPSQIVWKACGFRLLTTFKLLTIACAAESRSKSKKKSKVSASDGGFVRRRRTARVIASDDDDDDDDDVSDGPMMEEDLVSGSFEVSDSELAGIDLDFASAENAAENSTAA